MSKNQREADFAGLFSKHEAEIRRCILLWVPNWNDAQDLMQQVSIVVWQKSGQFEVGTNFVGWALRIARLEAKDYWRQQERKRRRFSDDFIDLVAADADEMSEELENRRTALRACVSQLKPTHRELLDLRYEEDNSLDAIAEKSNRTVDAVQKALSRIRNSLFQCVTRRISNLKRS